MIADVSAEALRMVKHAFSGFRGEMTGITSRTHEDVEEILRERRRWLNIAENDVWSTQKKIRKLEEEDRRLQDLISKTWGDHNRCADEVKRLTTKIIDLDNRIASLYNSMDHIDMRSNDSEEQRQQSAVIERAKNEIAILKSKKLEMERRRDGKTKEKQRLYTEVQQLKAERAKGKQEKEKEESRLYKQRDKLDRLRAAYARMKINLEEYANVAKSFAAVSDQNARKNMNAIDKCIYSIDKYINMIL
ncbi:MAG: hypothetical protein Q4C50_03275 [Eubacteriales bacterium]|nr:hypothetical protein [Eubacteriales bacterium]